MAYPRYPKGPVSAFTVNTGQPQAGGSAPQLPLRPPTTQAVGGFGGQAPAAPGGGAVQQLAARLASGTNPSSGLPGSIPDPVTSGPGPTGAGNPPTSGTSSGIPGGYATQDALSQAMGEQAKTGFGNAMAHGSFQTPNGPGGTQGPDGSSYFVPNGMTIDQITGGAPNPLFHSYPVNSGWAPDQLASAGFSPLYGPDGVPYWGHPAGAIYSLAQALTGGS